MFVYHLFLPVFYVCMYVYILSYFVNKLEIWWLYLSPIEKKKKTLYREVAYIVTQVYTTEHSKQKKDKLDERKYYTSIYKQIVRKIKHIITHSHTYTHPDIYTLP